MFYFGNYRSGAFVRASFFAARFLYMGATTAFSTGLADSRSVIVHCLLSTARSKFTVHATHTTKPARATYGSTGNELVVGAGPVMNPSIETTTRMTSTTYYDDVDELSQKLLKWTLWTCIDVLHSEAQKPPQQENRTRRKVYQSVPCCSVGS